jgi:hypothetical protein
VPLALEDYSVVLLLELVTVLLEAEVSLSNAFIRIIGFAIQSFLEVLNLFIVEFSKRLLFSFEFFDLLLHNSLVKLIFLCDIVLQFDILLLQLLILLLVNLYFGLED